MRLLLEPEKLGGTLMAMPSKSASHRMAICALLAGRSQVDNLGCSQDIDATLGAMSALGFEGWRLDGQTLHTGDSPRTEGEERVHCGESGSTLRFLIPLGLDGKRRVFTGSSRLLQRSMQPYVEIFAQRGWRWQHDPEGIAVEGEIQAGEYRLRGDVSSQFVSGLLFALAGLAGDSQIRLTGGVESRGYIDLTLAALAEFGVEAGWQGVDGLLIPGGQRWRSAHVLVEGDYSHAAFFLVAGILGRGTCLRGLDKNSCQGDREIISVLRAMGAQVDWQENTLCAWPCTLRGSIIDAAQIPDLAPILAVAACGVEGVTEIVNAARLRDKESDRLAAMATELNALGAEVEERPDGLRIQGRGELRGGVCGAHGDHRVAMALAIAASLCRSQVLLDGAEHVAKSAPQFWEEYTLLGGEHVEIS